MNNTCLSHIKPLQAVKNTIWATGIPPLGGGSGESGTKQLYQPEPKPQAVVYIVPITSILGRLPLIPVGDHGTISTAIMCHGQSQEGAF